MADEDKQSKTEQPTSKRLADAKEKGNIPRSMEMSATVSLLVAFVALYATGSYMVATLRNSTHEILSGAATFNGTQMEVYRIFLKLFISIGATLAPFVLIVIAAGIVINYSQGGVTIAPGKLGIDLKRINPLQGVARLFNSEAVMTAFKGLVKILLVGYIAYRILRDELNNIIYLVESDIQGIIDFVSHLSFKLVLHTCGLMLILAVIDLAFVKWRYMQNLKMTKQEVKDEHKDIEGDPQVKSRLKQMQIAQARRRLKKIIPLADVVVTNPTHFAVALKYEREKMGAPIVIAKGIDFMAQRIKEIARENDITLVENRFLARELYAQVEEGQEIPEALYAAVAEILAYVYSLKGKK